MPNWKDILVEIQSAGSTYDIIRRKYCKHLADVTKRNVIAYYSGWLQKAELGLMIPIDFSISDSDKNGFMTCINKMDKGKGLDLILHTPGGGVAATESLVDYLRLMFGTNIRVIIPQIAMSAGTMIACAAKSILMGKHSNLGPIDPQIAGLAAHGIIEEFKRAADEITINPFRIPLWQPIIAKYHPTLIGECEKAIQWSSEIVKEWLMTGMFLGEADAKDKAERIVLELGDHALTKSHARHISAEKAKSIGLKIEQFDDNDDLQDAILSLHHSFIHTLSATPAFKIIENNLDGAFIQVMKQIQA